MQAKQPDQLNVTELSQDTYQVINETKGSSYTVSCGVAGLHHPVCNCPARKTCKHIFAVQEYRESMEAESNVTPIDQKPKVKPFKRPILEILEDFQKPIPKRFMKTKSLKGNRIEFVPWYNYIKLLDYYAPGFDWSVRTHYCGDRTVVEGRLTIRAAEGDFSREATGTEDNDVDAYGNPVNNAEASALRRCCAKFGMGLSLWEKD